MPVYPKTASDISYSYLHDYRRPRPNPYLAASNLSVVSGVGADVWGNYTTIMAIGAYAFGDDPNRIQLQDLVIEDISQNDVIVMEFYRSPDAVVYTPVGAVRFSRASPQTRSFSIVAPTRDVNVDTDGMYARIKSAAGGCTVRFSVMVGRFIQTSYYATPSTGAWPTG